MAVHDAPESVYAALVTRERFGIAQDAPPEVSVDQEHDQKVVQQALRKKIADAAEYATATVVPGRELSLALRHLEEALMWAGKAIFK